MMSVEAKSRNDPNYRNTREFRSALITHLKIRMSAQWINLKSAIVAKYVERKYILTEGELEDYLSLPKGLEHVIEFCEHDLLLWCQNSQFKDEMKNIFDGILV